MYIQRDKRKDNVKMHHILFDFNNRRKCSTVPKVVKSILLVGGVTKITTHSYTPVDSRSGVRPTFNSWKYTITIQIQSVNTQQHTKNNEAADTTMRQGTLVERSNTAEIQM